MAFDDKTRGRLQKLVTTCRGLLMDEFRIQVQQTYGLDPNTGDVTPFERLTHLSATERETADLLRQTLAHYLASEGLTDRASQRVPVIDRIVREQAFTVLNRLAALLMMEARGVLQRPAVGAGQQSPAFELYKMVAGSTLGETGQAYQTFLFSLFDEFAQELPTLFDLFAPQGRLFPREAALLQVLAELNHHEIQPLWGEDETIGWIYQYFNSKEERKAMRNASQAPRNSRELAVRNQFFTPRYVVEFLVDNTLGRLWFNATGGVSGLRERCQYLLVKPDETPQASTKLRDPRTLKLLDPACGSMHFGLYAFDLFAEIYREAWAWEQQHGPGSLDVSTQPQAAFRPLTKTYKEEAAFLRDVPRLIIEHNIYGVDIDPRAAQIASLALWLRSQRAWQDAGVQAKNRPLVGQGHVIAAIAPPTERELRQQFTTDLDQRDAELFEKTLQILKGLPELGVLLQVERELPRLIKQVYVGKGAGLFAEQEQQNWQQAEARLRTALSEFAQTSKSTYQGRLFAQDALQGLRLIDLCGEVFDVVVMNPPFGQCGADTKEYVFTTYPDAKYDLFACFVDRCFDLLSPGGMLGALTNRTALSLESLDRWRERVFLGDGRITSAIDLGYGVLDDAMVEAAAYVLKSDSGITQFQVIGALDAVDKERSIIEVLHGNSRQRKLFVHTHSTFAAIPGTPISYFVPEALVTKLRTLSELSQSGFSARAGLQTCDDYRFLRLVWEVSHESSTEKARWVHLAKGGEYQPFISTLHLVANWAHDGIEMKAYAEKLYQQWSRTIPSVEFQLRHGVTYSERTTSDLSLRVLPAGCLFTKTGPGIYGLSEDKNLALIAISYSRLFRLSTELFLGSGDESVSGSAARHYRTALLAKFPYLVNGPQQEATLAAFSLSAIKQWIVLTARHETSPFFLGFGDHSRNHSFSEMCESLVGERLGCIKTLCGLQGQIEEEVLAAANLELEDLEAVAELVGESPHLYPRTISTDVEEVITRQWNLSESDLIDEIKADLGPRRQLVKKSYLSDRKVELISHGARVCPESLVSFLESRKIVTKDEKAEYAASIASFLLGCAFGRWTHLNIDAIRMDVLERNPFDRIPIAQPCAKTSLIETSRSLLVVDLYQPGSNCGLVDALRHQITDVFPVAEGLEQELLEALGVDSFLHYFSQNGKFFASHLRTYSESRRQAPIYWPLATTFGSYTLWIYYPSLTSQTLYTGINDFVEPRLKQVGADLTTLRSKGSARTRDDEKQFEALQAFELELIELRDTLLTLAPTYKPNHDDGVQISAAPLWLLFRHKPWQKVLKDTWAKLEKGDYDWAYLAMNYWPDRVREKCKTDKSLAIAHGLEDLYVEPEAAPKKTRGRKKADT